MPTPTAKRERAKRIRQLADEHKDAVTATLYELEAQAEAQEAASGKES